MGFARGRGEGDSLIVHLPPAKALSLYHFYMYHLTSSSHNWSQLFYKLSMKI